MNERSIADRHCTSPCPQAKNVGELQSSLDEVVVAVDQAYHQLKVSGDLQRYEADRALRIQLNERTTNNLGFFA